MRACKVLGAAGQKRRFHAELRQRLILQPAHALLQTVEQRQRKRRLRDLQRNARKARAGADVEQGLSCQRLDLPQRQTVEQVQLGDRGGLFRKRG